MRQKYNEDLLSLEKENYDFQMRADKADAEIEVLEGDKQNLLDYIKEVQQSENARRG